MVNKIDKLEHCHLDLRSMSSHSRRLFRHSNSHSGKKSLKMSDLNSSSKKSAEKSVMRSTGKKTKAPEQLSHSEKKVVRLVGEEQQEIKLLEKEIRQLSLKYRNLARIKEPSEEDGRQLDEVLAEQMEKK